jgi:hypothetical protein
MNAELGCPAYTNGSHYEDDLSEHQVEKTKLLFEDGTALFNFTLELS